MPHMDLGHPSDIEAEPDPLAGVPFEDEEPEPEADPAEEALDTSLSLRMPIFRVCDREGDGYKDEAARTDAYEEYMILTAYTRGNLAEARHGVRVRLDVVTDQWDSMDGWEFYMNGRPRTDKGVELAKTDADPDLAAKRRTLRRLEARMSEEMERMDREATICSRAYTLLSRGGM